MMFVMIFGLEINLAKVHINEMIKSIFSKMEASIICKYIYSELKFFLFCFCFCFVLFCFVLFCFFFFLVRSMYSWKNIQTCLHNDKDYT